MIIALISLCIGVCSFSQYQTCSRCYGAKTVKCDNSRCRFGKEKIPCGCNNGFKLVKCYCEGGYFYSACYGCRGAKGVKCTSCKGNGYRKCLCTYGGDCSLGCKNGKIACESCEGGIRVCRTCDGEGQKKKRCGNTGCVDGYRRTACMDGCYGSGMISVDCSNCKHGRMPCPSCSE